VIAHGDQQRGEAAHAERRRSRRDEVPEPGDRPGRARQRGDDPRLLRDPDLQSQHHRPRRRAQHRVRHEVGGVQRHGEHGGHHDRHEPTVAGPHDGSG
jgi:hypothetical protein